MTSPPSGACITKWCTRRKSTGRHGYCRRCYGRHRDAGRFGRIDAAETAAHIKRLRDLAWTWQQIADAAGVSMASAYDVWCGRHKKITAANARAILGIQPVRLGAGRRGRGIDVTGTRRRVQALMWMGWPGCHVATAADMNLSTLRDALDRGSISPGNAGKITVAYIRISHLPGSSDRARQMAARKGYPPPAAWDGIDMDDPAARPCGMRRSHRKKAA